MGIRVGFHLCHAEGPFADLTSEGVMRVLERYCKSDCGWTDDPHVERIAAAVEEGGVLAVLAGARNSVKTCGHGA